jgi:YaiO family outer membrane protein
MRRAAKPGAGGRAHTSAVLLAGALLSGSAFASAPACPHGAEAAGTASPAERFECARRLARSGAYEAALREYRELAEHHPDNVDYLFGEAQVRFWSGDTEGALRLLPRARRLAPHYEAVWQLEHQVLASYRGPDAESRREAFRSAALLRFPDAAWLRRGSADPGTRLAWEVGMNVDSLDNGAEDWRHVYAGVDRRTQAGNLLSLALSEHRRFGLADREVAVGGSFELLPDWNVDAGLRSSPDAEFLPETTIKIGVGRVLEQGWVLGANFRQRRYASNTVGTAGVDVQRYFGRFRAAWQLQNTRLDSASSFVHVATLNFFSDSGSRYGLTIAAGDEVEVVAPGQLLEMDVSAATLSGTHPLGERFDITWRAGTHQQGSFYRRNTIGLSIAGQF